MECRSPLNDLSGPDGRVSLIHSIKHKDDFARDLLIQTVERRDDREVSSKSENFTVSIESFKESDF